jgi:sterol desaturase/sphingolipid hydroxylase (fatty acid hydroxylase superfamily)
MSLIVLAIPVFFLLIGLEILFTLWEGKRFYRLADAVSDLSCGILEQVAGVFMKTAVFAGYLFVYERFRLATLPASSALVWLSCWLGVDFFYYWFHRASHEINAGWAAHIVHHQSEDMNLAVALRQSVFQGALSWVFYLPLALLGFPPALFLTVSALNTLYQFWIHTRLIGKMGPLEWVLNTPSHHRVHHGRNPRYIDKNHAGSLIIWDRMFGTFQEEQEEVVYGITKPLASSNPVWANLHYWAELWALARRAARPLDRLRVFAKRPGWRPPDLGGFEPAPEVDPATCSKYDPAIAKSVAAYVFAQFVLVNLLAAAFLRGQSALSAPARIGLALWTCGSVLALGGLLDRRPWAVPLEAGRLLTGAGLGMGLLPAVPAMASLVLGLGSTTWLLGIRGQAAPATPNRPNTA